MAYAVNIVAAVNHVLALNVHVYFSGKEAQDQAEVVTRPDMAAFFDTLSKDLDKKASDYRTKYKSHNSL